MKVKDFLLILLMHDLLLSLMLLIKLVPTSLRLTISNGKKLIIAQSEQGYSYDSSIILMCYKHIHAIPTFNPCLTS